MGRAHGAAAPPVPAGRPTGVPIAGIIAGECDGAIGDDGGEQEPHQGAPERETGPRRAGEHSPVVGAVPGREVARGAEQVGHSWPTGRQ